ncbi:MAG: hypothetical protein D8M59_02280 [Planctomycetes bacterium]|nr:hypothetical protein [Planctomycetota bacterium]NOG54452.1 endonuclease/exonuclease/phosphatase family protein [Planctomycetota bacterium]
MSLKRWMPLRGWACPLMSIGCVLLAGTPAVGRQDAPAQPAEPSHTAPVVIDGDFSDWADLIPSSPNIFPTSDTTFADIGFVWTRADSQWLYLRFEMRRVLNLQGMDGTITLRLDLDGNPDTGATLEGLSDKLTMGGVDVELLFSPTGARGRPMGTSARIYRTDGSASSTMNPYLLKTSFAPTYATDSVELRISRDGIEAGEGNPIARTIAVGSTGVQGQLFATDRTGMLVDHSDVFRFPSEDFEASSTGSPAALPFPTPSRAPGTRVRCISWNVHRGELFKSPAAFARVLTALDPDVICFQELDFNATTDKLQQWLRQYLVDGDSWEARVSPNTGTGVASRLSTVAVGPTVMPAVGTTNRSLRATSLLIGVPGSGLTPGRRIVFISTHMKCCGTAGDSSDLKRIEEGNLIHTLLRRIRYDADPSGIVVMGDFNLVGSRAPLDAIMRAEDLDGSDLLDVAPNVLGDQINTTWRSSNEPFLPGRLDFALVSDSTLPVLSSFVFDTHLLPTDLAAAMCVESDDTTQASDHLPIVVDLGW